MIHTEIKAHRSFVDPFYKVEYKGSYYLSAQLGKDGFYLALLDTTNNTYLATEEFIFEGIGNAYQLKDEFEKRLASSQLLKSSYENMSLGMINEFSALVPEALYDENHKKDYFELTLGKTDDLVILEDNLINTKSKNVFALPQLILTSIQSNFPKARINHFSSPLIDGMSLNYKQIDGEHIVLHIQYSHFEILYFNNGELQFYNSFNYTTAEDFIYYLMFSIEQLGLNPEKISVKVVGEVESDSSTYTLLFKYVRNVTFGERPKTLNYSTALDVLSSHHYYNLYQQYLCV